MVAELNWLGKRQGIMNVLIQMGKLRPKALVSVFVTVLPTLPRALTQASLLKVGPHDYHRSDGGKVSTLG